MMKRNLWASLALTAAFATACSHAPKKMNYSITTSPSEVVETMEADIQDGYANQVDVLARDDFAQGQDYLRQAQAQIKKGDKQEKVLRTLGQARAYLDRAKSLANGRRANVEGILQARQAALNAGARSFPRQREELGEIDDDMRKAAGDRNITPSDFSTLQNRYLALELASIQSVHLNDARARVEGAKQKNARRLTPQTLSRAETDLRNAENMIASHRHEEEAFRPAVERANASSNLLVAVGQKARAGKAVIPEDVALKLVFQERALKNMNQKLETLETLSDKTSEQLSAQDQELKKAREAQALEEALAQARKEFSSDEAEVYRDGSKLLIRLKAMNFPSGRADLRPQSLALLSKVKQVTEKLQPMQVVIEGHTDSIGNEQLNGPLSQKRAEAVARYLESNGVDSDKIQAVGLGFKKPIANNKSKTGRAQNRRVDIIITPGGVETATTSM